MNLKKYLTLTTFLLLAQSEANAETCYQMVEKSDLQPRVIDGQEVYVVAKSAVETPCNLYQKARDAAVKAQAQSKKHLAQLEEMNNRYKELYQAKESYYDLVIKYEKALEKSSVLIGDFEAHSNQWAHLYKDYSNLANDYDKLSDTYRNIAKNFTSPISFDVGGGITEDHDFAGVIGVGIHRFKIWGFFQEDNNGLLATYSFPWSSLD